MVHCLRGTPARVQQKPNEGKLPRQPNNDDPHGLQVFDCLGRSTSMGFCCTLASLQHPENTRSRAVTN